MLPMVLTILFIPLVVLYLLVVLLVLDISHLYAQYSLIVPLSYVLGAIPWGFLLTWATKRVDIRQYGSGKTGMSNVLRTAGGRVAFVVLLLDISKGLLAVLLARVVAGTAEAEVAAGLLALVGHNWSMFLGFKGGRGIATGLGALLLLAPIAGGLAVASFIPVTLLSRYLSLGSLAAVVTGFFSLVALTLLKVHPITYLWYGALAGTIIIWQHRDNIQRILQGKERRLGQPAAARDQGSGG